MLPHVGRGDTQTDRPHIPHKNLEKSSGFFWRWIICSRNNPFKKNGERIFFLFFKNTHQIFFLSIQPFFPSKESQQASKKLFYKKQQQTKKKERNKKKGK